MYESLEKLAYELRLFGLRAHLERRCEQAIRESLHPRDFLGLLLDDEKVARSEAAAKRLEARARFRHQATLEEWDMSFPRGLSKAKLQELIQLDFMEKKQNLIIEGSTGVGKTHLAIAVGKLACRRGRSTKFYSTNFFFEEIQADRLAGRYLQTVKNLAKIDVLILDDFGLRGYAHQEAMVLQDLLEERYGRGVNILTSQIHPSGWRSLFEDPAVGESITDRLRKPSDSIKLEGASYRAKRSLN